MKIQNIQPSLLKKFRQGMVIPAMPLALTANHEFDRQAQEALARYYMDAGAGGIAAGVHSTQFAIREHGLYETVLICVAHAIVDWSFKTDKSILTIAGVCGKTRQAVEEALTAKDIGYHAVMLSLSAMKGESLSAMIDHCAQVAEVMPLIGFYLQSAVGGPDLPYTFWRQFVQIPNVMGIKIAPFNRYKTLDVVRALCEAEKEKTITLYTGNDDAIVPDLITEYKVKVNGKYKKVRIKGGLLGHWSVWTKKAVELLDEIHTLIETGQAIPCELLSRGVQITDCNAAFFDAANNFSGCIPGIHEVLCRQGLIKGNWCLDPAETLSAGQSEEIERVSKSYPHLNDDKFVKANLNRWMDEEVTFFIKGNGKDAVDT